VKLSPFKSRHGRELFHNLLGITVVGCFDYSLSLQNGLLPESQLHFIRIAVHLAGGATLPSAEGAGRHGMPEGVVGALVCKELPESIPGALPGVLPAAAEGATGFDEAEFVEAWFVEVWPAEAWLAEA
jgi:hypothetical protein